jgi:hypothetical protein
MGIFHQLLLLGVKLLQLILVESQLLAHPSNGLFQSGDLGFGRHRDNRFVSGEQSFANVHILVKLTDLCLVVVEMILKLVNQLTAFGHFVV